MNIWPTAEAGLLNAILLAPREMIPEFGSRLNPEHFFDRNNRLAFESVIELHGSGQPIEMVGMVRQLIRRGLSQQDARCFFMDLIEFLPFPINTQFYFDNVIEAFVLRQVAAQSRALSEETDMDGSEALERFGAVVEALKTARAAPKQNSLKDALNEKMQRMEHGVCDEDLLSTGLSELDEASPLRMGAMPLISGERKAGKSILALNILTNCAENNVPALYFSLETSVPGVMDRLMALLSKIPIIRHHVSKLDEGEREMIRLAQDRILKADFEVECTRDLDMICLRIRQFRKEHSGKAICCVDYAQLVDVKSANRSDNREQQVSRISRTIRALAIELNLPILLVCQLNTAGESRESRALEQDATAGWKLVRADPDVATKRAIHIPWQRDGESNIYFEVAFLGHIAKICNLAKGEDCRAVQLKPKPN